MSETKEEKKVEKKETEAVFVEVPTQYARGVQLPDGDVITLDELQLRTYNLLQKLIKTL